MQILNFKYASSSFKIFNSNDLNYWYMLVILVLEPLPLWVTFIFVFLEGSGINCLMKLPSWCGGFLDFFFFFS